MTLPLNLTARRYGQLLRIVDQHGATRAHLQFNLFDGGEAEATAFATALCDAYNSIHDFVREQESK